MLLACIFKLARLAKEAEKRLNKNEFKAPFFGEKE